MRIHCLEHVWFEDSAIITDWANHKGYSITKTRFFKGERLPDQKTFDFLVILGGPMNIYQDTKYPWLKEEKVFIEKAINNDKVVLGICLGAQLIASSLGAKISVNKDKEIGWFTVTTNTAGTILLPKKFKAFHFHEDTFELPKQAKLLAETKACRNQAFSFNKGKVIGLQFHLELKADGIKAIIDNADSEIIENKFIQSPLVIMNKNHNFASANKIMTNLLNIITETQIKKEGNNG